MTEDKIVVLKLRTHHHWILIQHISENILESFQVISKKKCSLVNDFKPHQEDDQDNRWNSQNKKAAKISVRQKFWF